MDSDHGVKAIGMELIETEERGTRARKDASQLRPAFSMPCRTRGVGFDFQPPRTAPRDSAQSQIAFREAAGRLHRSAATKRRARAANDFERFRRRNLRFARGKAVLDRD